MIWFMHKMLLKLWSLFLFLHYTDYTKSKYTEYTQHTQAFLGSAKIYNYIERFFRAEFWRTVCLPIRLMIKN